MEVVESKKASNYILFRERKKFECIQGENLKLDKLNLLTKMVNNQENMTYSKLHNVYMKYFPEWNLIPNKMIVEIYKRLIKKYPNDFVSFRCNESSTFLENKLNLIKRNVINFEQILLDYNCIKNISIFILNCIHSIVKSKNKKLCINAFLQREKLNLLHSIFQEFFDEMETIKFINIQLFDTVSTPDTSNTHKTDNFIISRHQTLSTTSSDIFKSTCISEGNRIVKLDNNSLEIQVEKIEIDYVYVFYLFLEIIFPNHLELEMNLSMSSLLEKNKNKKGEYKNINSLNKKFEAHFLTILLTTYFISKDKKIQKLKLKTSDSLKFEMDNYINYILSFNDNRNARNEITKELIFLDNFFRTLNFNIFHTEINSLDPLLFNRTNLISMNNLGIRSLHITLFPADSLYFNDKMNLFKLRQLFPNPQYENNNNIHTSKDNEVYPRVKSMTSKVNNNSSNTINKFLEVRPSIVYFSNLNLDEELYSSDSYEILNKLFPSFEENLRDLFLIIESKVNILRDIKIVINPPKMLIEQINYLSLLTAFIYNVFKILENNSNEIISVEIDSDKLPLDYLLLGILKNKEVHIDLRKLSIVNLVLNVKLENYLNVLRFIPENVVCINLAALTNESFIFLVAKLKKKFHKFKNLVELSISVNITNSNISKLVEYIHLFFMLNKPKNLENLRMNMKYILSVSDIKKLMDIIQNKDNYFKYQDKVKNIFLDYGISTNIKYDEISRRFNFFRFDNKFENKLEKFLYAMKHSKSYNKLYHHSHILKSICNFLYTYSKIVNLE